MKVIMIEDSESKKENILRSIAKYVKREDVDVFTYRNAGLLALRNNKDYDLLILDMQFPAMSDTRIEHNSGIFVLAELKRTGNKIPTIMCTSSDLDYSKYNAGNVIGHINYDSSVDMRNLFESLLSSIK